MRHLATITCTAIGTLLLGGCVGGEPPRPRGDGRDSEAVVGEGATVVVTLGDSITAGTPRWDPDPGVRARIDSPDPKSQWQYWAAREHPRLRFRNCGVNRERTDEIAERLDRCLQGAPYLVVQGGINDIAQGRSVEAAAGSLRRMVRAGAEAGAVVLLAQVLPWNDGYPDFSDDIDELNERIADIAREEGIVVLEFHEALEDPDRPGRMRDDWTIDGSHPSIEGHRRLGTRAFRLPERDQGAE